MKKILLLLFFSFVTYSVIAQDKKPASYVAPVMTPEFIDYLKIGISGLIDKDYRIELSYTSTISPEGKLLKPFISREYSYDNEKDNDFVTKMRLLIMAAPAWKPAMDTTLNTSISDNVLFEVDIKKGKISIFSLKPH